MSYKPTTPVTPTRKKTKPKTGITFPKIVKPDTGIHTIRSLKGLRFKIWFENDGRKQYVSLPAGIDIEEARKRRDRLYDRLKAGYDAKRRTPQKGAGGRREVQTTLRDSTFIYYRPASWVIRIRGKKVGETFVKSGQTEDEAKEVARLKRDAWFAENPGVVKNLIVEP